MTLQRLQRLLKAAANCTESLEGRNRIEAIRCFIKQEGRVTTVVAIGTWNNVYKFDEAKKFFHLIDTTPARIAHLLERHGVALEWADEWVTCQTCGRLVRCRYDCVSESILRHGDNLTCATAGTRRDHSDELPKDRFTTEKVFRVASVSANRNAFGLRGMILIAPDGEAWQVGTSDHICKRQGEIIRVPLLGRIRTFGSLGFEVPRQLADAPSDVIAEVWK